MPPRGRDVAYPSCRAGSTPLPVRFYRLARAAAHVVEGLATIVIAFPFLRPPRRQTLVMHWSARLLRMFAIVMRIDGVPPRPTPRGLLLVANHVSWLDIFALNAAQPARFVAKSELRRWPLVGWLIAGVGTLFIERERRRHTHAVNRRVAMALAHGDVIAIFPEGTTSDGRAVLPFHGSLLQPIVEVGGQLQPVALRYCAITGETTQAAAFVGDMTFLRSLWRVTRERVMIVELRFGPPLEAGGRHRRELARVAETAIRASLASACCSPEPGKSGDPRA